MKGQTTLVGRAVRLAYIHMMDEINAGIAEQYAFATPAINQVMAVIDSEGSRVTDLARRSNMTKQSMGELVDRMEELGMVVRRSDPNDRRAKLVHLTDYGWETMRTGYEVSRDLHRHWEALLGKQKTSQLIALLDELLNELADEAAGRNAVKPDTRP